jgi:hypothetical protein
MRNGEHGKPKRRRLEKMPDTTKKCMTERKEAEAALARIKETDSVKAKNALANANAALANIETIMKNPGSRSGSRSTSNHFLSNVVSHRKPTPKRNTTLRVQGGRRTIKKRRHQ